MQSSLSYSQVIRASQRPHDLELFSVNVVARSSPSDKSLLGDLSLTFNSKFSAI